MGRMGFWETVAGSNSVCIAAIKGMLSYIKSNIVQCYDKLIKLINLIN
jgi:hypothetical protein